nr:sensor histidine kinase [Parvularcula dongshanensis]
MYERELLHRMNNIFAMISALIEVNRRKIDNVDELADTLLSQTAALASAHRTSSGLHCTDGDDEAHSLAWFADSMLTDLGRAFLSAEWRSDVCLDANTFLPRGRLEALSMILYELATNSIKYGTTTGNRQLINVFIGSETPQKVRVSWTETTHLGSGRGDEFELRSKTSQGGFGSVLLAHCARTLDATIERMVEGHTFEVKLTFPVHAH